SLRRLTAGCWPDRTRSARRLTRFRPFTLRAERDSLEGHRGSRAQRTTEGDMATAIKRAQMFIGGEWVDGTGEATQPIWNPATGEVIAEVPKATAEDVDRAVAAARTAFDEVWFDSTPKERMQALLTLA